VTTSLLEVHTSLWAEFAGTAAVHGDAAAIAVPGAPPVTYGELAERAIATSAAWSHRGRTVAGRVVADASERGVGQIVHFLAAQHAGAAYCALDPRRPEDFHRRAVELLSPRLLLRDGDVQDVTTESAPGELPGDSANVLFTTGTTGTPRAILQTGEQLRWFTGNPGLAPLRAGERVAHCSSAGFDTYLFEVVRTLLTGATVTVLPRFEDVFRDGVGPTLAGAGVTVMLAPATLVNSAARVAPDAFNSLRILYSGGSELYADSVAAVLGAGFASSFVNLYGPAEGVVTCTAHPIDHPGDGVVPLGRPLPGITATLVEEETGAELPAGAGTGRLRIAGDGISAGYLDRDRHGALVRVPFGDDGRTFLTSDIVTRDADGCLGFVRRTGGILKVNGVRTSRSELESHARTAGALVAAVAEKAGEPVLFVQLPPGTDAAGFLAALRRVGSASAVPRVRVVEEIPVNVNGKHDASLLPDEPAGRDGDPGPGEAGAAVRARLGEEVARIHGGPVPDGADLYDLGFSSLQLAMVLLAVTEREGVELSAEELLTTPDLDDLARLLAERGAGDR
jgi:non-ribosomal peptide synthetase component F/acyl carrier protein